MFQVHHRILLGMTLLSSLGLSSLQATGFSEVHVVEAQWMDIRRLLQTQIEALKEQEKTTENTAKIDKTTKAMETMQKAQAAIAYQMKVQIPALQQQGMLIQKSPNGSSRFIPANGLQFNSSTGSVEGGNFGFTDHLLSQRGVPISMDRVAPSFMAPLSSKQADLLLQKSKEFLKSAAKPLLRAATDAVVGKGENASKIKSVLNQVGDRAIQGMLGEGVFVRPYEGGKDDAYAYYQNASPQEKMAYYASSLYRNGSTIFNPILGSLSEKEGGTLPSSVDLSNTLSMGAKAAVEAFLEKGGKTPTEGTFHTPSDNPYDHFAAELYDEVLNAIQQGQIKAGDPIVVTEEMVKRARDRSEKSSVPESTKEFPPMFNNRTTASWMPVFTPFLASIGSSGGVGLSGLKNYVLVVSGSASEMQQLDSMCSASDQRLGEIQKQIGYQTQMLDYTQQLLDSLRQMRTQAQSVQQSITAQNAIPQVTQFLASIDEAVAKRDQEIAGYQRTLQQLQGERYEELKSRSERVTANHRNQLSTANHQLARAAR